jgi:hypothetical protein
MRFARFDQDLYQGATWDLVLRVKNPAPPHGDGLYRSAVGLVVDLQIRSEPHESGALLASASTTDGSITTDADGYIRIRIPKAVTVAMPFLGRVRTWWYDVRISEAGGAEPTRVWIHGAINAVPRKTV